MTERIRKCICFWLTILLLAVCAGCGSMGGDNGERLAIDFTVVEGDDIPEELQEIIESHKMEEIKMTFEGDDGLYIIRGYGEQPAGGYSISADMVELSADGLHVTTTLIGPSSEENPAAEPSYPYIVLWVEKTGQEVQFE